MIRKNSWILFAFVAFCFGVICRIYWVLWASGYEQFFYNDEIMITTNDGYAFAEGARDMVNGFHQPNDLSYFGTSLSTLSAWIYGISGIKFESIMLYLSVILSPLLVVPIILISKELNSLKAGFLGALLAVVANSYYNRTMAGYYDTDMLNITLAMFVLWAQIRLIVKKDEISIAFIAIFMIIYDWWYASSYSLMLAMSGLFLAYVVAFEQKCEICYKGVIFMLLSMLQMPILAKFLLLGALFLSMKMANRFWGKRNVFIALAISFCLFALFGGLSSILFSIKFYIFRDVATAQNLHFFNVNETIRESAGIGFETIAVRISGHLALFFFSFVGFVLALVRNRVLILGLPMLILGLISFKTGLRFTIYSVPVMGFGFGYWAVFLCDFIKKKFLANFALCIFGVLALIAPLNNIKNYKISPVFIKDEVENLVNLKSIASREDYVLTWWDYGYPVRYYSDVKTLIDGGKHLGQDNFAVSFALGQNQQTSANMARLEVEYTERNFSEKFGLNLAKMMSDYGIADVNEFLASLNGVNLALPQKTREIYYYLPDRMIYIFPTILAFSNLDLKTGHGFSDSIFIMNENLTEQNGGILLTRGVILSDDGRQISINGVKINVNSFVQTEYGAQKKLNVKTHKFDESSDIFVIFMKNYGRILLLDKKLFNSAYIQLFVLENYDKSLFEPVILRPEAKIYKLKI